MISSIASLQSSSVRSSNDITLSSFPASLVLRYDLFYENGRQTSTGSNVTTANAHIYKILDKSGNDHHLYSRSQDSSPSNKFVSSGLGSLGKPCVSINSTTTGNTTTTTGYVTTTYPLFPDGYELICVIKPLQFTVSGSGIKSQNLVNKYLSPSGFPYPFCVRTNRVIGNGSTSSSWDNTTNLDMLVTPSAGYILGSRFFKANGGINGNTTVNGQAQERLNGLDNGTFTVATPSNYVDSSTALFGLCYRPTVPNQNQAFEIGEILMFDEPIRPADRELIEGYLATKWGITITNTSHSYYNQKVVYTGTK
jgi:hypothetical protein